MPRLIDADALYEKANMLNKKERQVVQSVLLVSPTIEAEPVKHGRWIKLDAYKGIEQFKCSICRSECYVPTCIGEPMYAFCPNCGNPMDGEDGGNDHD